MCEPVQALELAHTCTGRDGRKGTVDMTFPPVEKLAKALGVLADGGVRVTLEQNETADTETPRSCWRDIRTEFFKPHALQ